MRFLFVIAVSLGMPLAALADGIFVEGPYIPLAPPGMMTHAAYFTLNNSGEEPRLLVGVSAAGYAMAHLHLSSQSGGVGTMAALDQIEIAPGRKVVFAPGGLHVMLMHPAAPQKDGATVELTLHFANGETLVVEAPVRRIGDGS